MSQKCHSAKNHEAISKTEAIFLNFFKFWRKESVLIFLIKAILKILWKFLKNLVENFKNFKVETGATT